MPIWHSKRSAIYPYVTDTKVIYTDTYLCLSKNLVCFFVKFITLIWMVHF